MSYSLAIKSLIVDRAAFDARTPEQKAVATRIRALSMRHFSAAPEIKFLEFNELIPAFSLTRSSRKSVVLHTGLLASLTAEEVVALGCHEVAHLMLRASENSTDEMERKCDYLAVRILGKVNPLITALDKLQRLVPEAKGIQERITILKRQEASKDPFPQERDWQSR